MMRTSPAGIELIKRNEGCELRAYLDTIADPPVWTIGYGCTGPDIHEGLRWTQEQADRALAERLAREFEPGVMAAIRTHPTGVVPTTQAQFDAMVSLAWNIGVGRLDDPETPENEGRGFKGSSVARYHRAGDYQRAADAFRLWNRAGGKVVRGLSRRREEERELYLKGTSAQPAPPPSYDRYLCAKAMQTALHKLGLYPGPVDGIWGTKSRAAYNRFNNGDPQ